MAIQPMTHNEVVTTAAIMNANFGFEIDIHNLSESDLREILSVYYGLNGSKILQDIMTVVMHDLSEAKLDVLIEVYPYTETCDEASTGVVHPWSAIEVTCLKHGSYTSRLSVTNFRSTELTPTQLVIEAALRCFDRISHYSEVGYCEVFEAANKCGFNCEKIIAQLQLEKKMELTARKTERDAQKELRAQKKLDEAAKKSAYIG